MALLRLEEVDTYYGEIHILQRVRLEVGEGELVCLLGGNASGKSTTLKTILGIVRPRRGSVELDGEDDHVQLLVASPPQVAVAAGELPQGRLGAAAAPTLPGTYPPGAPVVAVVLRRVGWWRSAGDAQAVHPPAAHPESAGLTPP